MTTPIIGEGHVAISYIYDQRQSSCQGIAFYHAAPEIYDSSLKVSLHHAFPSPLDILSGHYLFLQGVQILFVHPILGKSNK
jgi:hypothetical protein